MVNFEPQSNLLKQQLSETTNVDGSVNLESFLKLVDHAYLDNINELKQSRDHLIEATNQASRAARVSGMAEVATNVLHNIGNTLNSVNTTVALLVERFKNTKFKHFDKLAIMLEQHKHNLNDYFIHDPKGKLIPAYILELAKHWREQVPLLSTDLIQLTKNIDHIKDCIALQQSMAKSAGMLEPTDLSRMLDSIVDLQAKEFSANAIKIVKDYQPLPQLMLDRIKLYQIFVNFLQNGRQSIAFSRSNERILHIKIESDHAHFVSISMKDTGIGINEENLKKIFSHGFTTKKDGHGFGLHYCANAANEMGGKISVESDGEGLGATFTLILPYQLVDYGEANAS